MSTEEEVYMSGLVTRGEAALAHFGKKGMKWGVTTVRAANDRIRTSKTTGIKAARVNVRAQKAAIKAAPTKEAQAKLTKDLKVDPNRVAGRLLTKGEKAGLAVLAYGGMWGVYGVQVLAAGGVDELQAQRVQEMIDANKRGERLPIWK